MAKINVIIPYKTSGTDINKTVYSVLNQNFQDFEVLVISDNDVSLPPDKKLKNIKLNGKHNIPQLLNFGIKYSNSGLICFLNPNDLLLYNALKLRYEKFLQHPTIAACYGFGIDTDIDYKVKYNQSYEYFINYKPDLPENSIRTVLSGDISISVSSLMLRRDIFDGAWFNPFLKNAYTWDFIIRLFNRYEGEICQISDPVYISREEEYSIKHNNQKYFIEYLKESNYILDAFFNSTETSDKLKNLNLECFKNLYSYMFYILIEYFPLNFWLRFYLLISYLKKNRQLDNKLIDLWFIAALINSLSVSKKQLLSETDITAKA